GDDRECLAPDAHEAAPGQIAGAGRRREQAGTALHPPHLDAPPEVRVEERSVPVGRHLQPTNWPTRFEPRDLGASAQDSNLLVDGSHDGAAAESEECRLLSHSRSPWAWPSPRAGSTRASPSL